MKIGSFIAGLMLIIAGLVIFLDNMGYGSLPLFTVLLKFWPVILILIGISFFWGGAIPRLLGILLIIALSGSIIALTLLNFSPSYELSRGQRQTTLVVDRFRYEGVISGEVVMAFGGGKITLDSGTGQIFEGLFRGAAGAVASVDRKNDEVKIRIGQDDGIRFFQPRNPADWTVHLSPDLPWNINLDAGAAEGDFDFTDLDFRKLNIRLGAGDFNFKFGGNGKYGDVKIQAGASNVKVQVDEKTGVRINVKGALASTNLTELGWPVIDQYYVSPGYDEALSRIDLELEMAVGNFELEVLSPQRIHL